MVLSVQGYGRSEACAAPGALQDTTRFSCSLLAPGKSISLSHSCCVKPSLRVSEQQCILLQMSCRDLLLSSSVLCSVWILGTVVLPVFLPCLCVPPARELQGAKICAICSREAEPNG